jgi:hypothetical protein
MHRPAKPHYEATDRLVKKMWARRARTPERRAAKVRVLLAWLMGGDWRENGSDADYPVKEARELMLNLSAASPLRNYAVSSPPKPCSSSPPVHAGGFRRGCRALKSPLDFNRLLAKQSSLT